MISPKGRVLCTEDDPDTRDLIATVSTLDGFEVICTDDPDQTLNLARAEHFDLYLLDTWLPGVSGPALCARLREFNLETPILFYSGVAYEKDKDAAFRSEAQGYLVQPADSDDLIAEVRRLIEATK